MLERRAVDVPYPHERRGAPRDRRGAQRYPAGGTGVVLSWTEDGRSCSIEGRLKDISLSGLAALADSIPPKGVHLWFRLKDDRASEWVHAALVEGARTGVFGLGRKLIRIKFLSACPYHVFKSAIDGFSQQVDVPEPRLGVYTRTDWR
jgi:hypothetical protein